MPASKRAGREGGSAGVAGAGAGVSLPGTMQAVSLVSYDSRRSLRTRNAVERDLITVLCVVSVETPTLKTFVADQSEGSVLENVCVILLRKPESKVELRSAIYGVLVESNNGIVVPKCDCVLVWVLQAQLPNHRHCVPFLGIILTGYNARSATLQ